MTNPIIGLTKAELAALAKVIDPVEEVVAEFTGGRAGGRLTPWHGPRFGGPAAGDLVLLDDREGGGRCLLPSSALCSLRTAAMVALAARELVAPGVITAAVLGFGLVAQDTLLLLERTLTGLSHAAICPGEDAPDRAACHAVIAALDRAGIGWSLSTAVAESVFGATLVVATVVTDPHDLGRPPDGTTVINTSGRDLPAPLVAAADQIVVDDLALLRHNAHRAFVRAHLAAGSHQRVSVDFTRLLTRTQPGRSHADDVLLVELLDTRKLDVGLASSLHRAALDLGLGVEVAE